MSRHREQLPRLRPCWDGIAGWIFVILALLGMVLSWDHVINGVDVATWLLAGVGLSLLARRALA